MKQVVKQFAKDLGKSSLRTTRTVTVGTVLLGSKILSTLGNSIVAGCNTGIKKIDGKKCRFVYELKTVHDIHVVANQIIDGRTSLEEAYDSMAPEEFKMVVDFIVNPYKKASKMDINDARI